MRSDELLIALMAPKRLQHELDRVPLWRGADGQPADHVSVKQLVEDFAKYLYLPRMKNSAVLIDSIRNGLGLLSWTQDSFAYADSYDAKGNRYPSLRCGEVVDLDEAGATGVLVKPQRAMQQRDAEAPKPAAGTPAQPGIGLGGALGAPGVVPGATPAAGPAKPKRFHGTVSIDPTRAGRDAGKIAEEVIAHLVGLVGAEATVTIEIDAAVPGGVSENVVRTVSENCRTLKFKTFGFEQE
jgi:hypothetical protein